MTVGEVINNPNMRNKDYTMLVEDLDGVCMFVSAVELCPSQERVNIKIDDEPHDVSVRNVLNALKHVPAHFEVIVDDESCVTGNITGINMYYDTRDIAFML